MTSTLETTRMATAGLARTTKVAPGDEDREQIDAERALDLALQGFTTREIAEALGETGADVEAALVTLVPGGNGAIRSSLRTRLRAWRRSEDRSWDDAEAIFGIPHANVLRLVRAPEGAAIDADSPEDGGYLDAIFAGMDLDDPRAITCARAYAMGATLQELGDRFGVTRERIRQILQRSTPWSSSDIGAALRRLREARDAEHRNAANAWSDANPAASIDTAVEVLGMPRDQVLGYLGRRRTRHEPAASKRGPVSRRGDDEILEDLRRFHAQTGILTAAAFSNWAREQGVPGHQTAAIRFGTWNEALRAAGLREDKGAPRSSFSDDDLWAALIAAVSAADGGTSVDAVGEWTRRHAAAPSAALMRHRLGTSWSTIVATALEVARGGEEMDPQWVARVTAPRNWDDAGPQVEDLQHVRDAIAVFGPSLTSLQYRDWARAHKRPGGPTLQRRTGKTWSRLVEEAGGRPNRRPADRVDDTVCTARLREFLELPGGHTSAEYSAWARDHEAPSLSTIIGRFGTWTRAKDVVGE